MRHTSLLGLPKPVPLLPPSMVFTAPLGPLVPAAGLPGRLTSRLLAAGPRAVPLPVIAARAHDHLASTSVAAQQSSVARGSAASPTGDEQGASRALRPYTHPVGLVPRRGSGLGLLHLLGPLPVFSQQRIIARTALRLACIETKQPTTTAQRQLLVCFTQRSSPTATRPIDSIFDLD